jgi:transposase InsO family protein
MQTTTALSGGAKYKPTTSRILVSSSGSVENLNVSTRQGCSFHLRQILATVAKEIPRWSPSSRADQCVTPVLSDNGSCYRSNLWKTTCVEHAIKHRRTRPYRPQTNGKVERFHRTLAVEWAYVRPYPSERARVQALRKWLHLYNHHRTHTALGGRPPASRVTNLSGQYI